MYSLVENNVLAIFHHIYKYLLKNFFQSYLNSTLVRIFLCSVHIVEGMTIFFCKYNPRENCARGSHFPRLHSFSDHKATTYKKYSQPFLLCTSAVQLMLVYLVCYEHSGSARSSFIVENLHL